MQDSMDDGATDDGSTIDSANPLGLANAFRHPQPQKSWRGKLPWENFSEPSSAGGASRVTPPLLPRGSSSGISVDEMSMDSPSMLSSSNPNNPFIFPNNPSTINTGATSGAISSGSGGDTTPQHDIASLRRTSSFSQSGGQGAPPSAADITRRINNKRRRGDDDLDPIAFKRRAVSPGMSVQGSPIMQSPAQHTPWGGGSGGSRPGSNSGEGSRPPPFERAGGSGGPPSECGSVSGGGGNEGKRLSMNGVKGRVGFQGMVDTNDGLTRLNID